MPRGKKENTALIGHVLRKREDGTAERVPVVGTKGENLYVRRLAAGLTQADLCRQARIDQAKLSLCENDLAELTSDELRRVEKELKGVPGLTIVDKVRTGLLPGSGYTALAASSPDAKYRKLLRKQAGLNQRELASRAKIPRNRLMQWEACKKDVILGREEMNRWEQAILEAKEKKAATKLTWARVESAFRIAEEARHQNELLQQLNASKDRQLADLREQVRVLREQNAEFQRLFQLKGAAVAADELQAKIEERHTKEGDE